MIKKILNFCVLLISLVFLPSVLNAKVEFGSNLPDSLHISNAGYAEPLYAYLNNLDKQDRDWVHSSNLASLEGRNATCEEDTKEYYYCPYVDGKRVGDCEPFKSAPQDDEHTTWKMLNQYRIMCSYDLADTSSATKIGQAIYSAGNGKQAYCVMPGRPFKSQTYYKYATWDVSKCKSSSESYHCALAAGASYVENNYGGDYLTMVTALRLITADYGRGSGWWDSETNIPYSKANMYVTTASAAKSGKYLGGSSVTGGTQWLFAKSSSALSALQNAITAFRAVSSGIKMWTPEIKVLPIEYNDYGAQIKVQTNFDASLKIKSVVGEKLGVITDYVMEGNVLVINVSKDLLDKLGESCDKIKVEYDYPEDVITKVALYVAPNAGYQDMVVFDKGAQSWIKFDVCLNNPVCTYFEGEWYDRDGNVTDRQGYQDSCLCVEIDGQYYVDYNEGPVSKEEFEERCEDKCDNTEIDYSDMVENCETDGSEGEIKDPAICGIINRKDGNYTKSEYSNSTCDVFCRETVKFTFMTKEEAQAGRFFQHDVKAKYSQIKNLSTVILSTRQCTATIKYDEWKEKYKEVNDQILLAWNNLKYWEGFYNLASGSHTSQEEGGGASGCNGCYFDPIEDFTLIWQFGAYCVTNSNGSTSCTDKAVFSADGVPGLCPHNVRHGCGLNSTYCYYTCEGSTRAPYQNKYDVVRNAYNSAVKSYKGLLDERDRLLYELQDCNFMADKSVESSGNTLYQTYRKPDGGHYVAAHAGNYNTKAELKTYNNVMKYNPKSEFYIEYEENEISSSGKGFHEGFPINTQNDPSEDSPNMVDVMNFSDQNDWESYCGDCNNDLHELSTSPYMEQLDYWSCSGSGTGGICTKISISVPKNYVTNILIDKESVTYQRNDLYTQVYTGNVSTGGSSEGYWIPMDPHVYPVGIKRITGLYDINVIWKQIGDQDRVVTFEPGEFYCVYQVINDLAVYDCDDGYHICYPCEGDNCESSTGNSPYDLGVYFRSIDLADVFPNSKYSTYYNGNISSSRPIGSNWDTQNAFQVVQEIQRLEQNSNNGFLKQTPQYQIVLSPSTRKEIKSYNKYTNYLDYSINCSSDLSCISNFLKSELKNILGVKYKDLYEKDSSINKNSLYYYTR